MRTITAWLNKLLHLTSKVESDIPKSAELCELCAQWDFSTVFLGRRYPAYEYGVIKDNSRSTLWDIRSLETLRLAKKCPMCSFFVALLVVRGQIKEETTSASEKDLVAQFKKESLTRYLGAVYLRITERHATQSSHVDSNSDDAVANSGREWITLLPESGSMSSRTEPRTTYTWGGRHLKPYCNFTELSSWVRECSEDPHGTHFDCWESRFETYTWKTLRLIDVKTMCLVVKQLPTKYAALSYVWGPPHLIQLKLHQMNVEKMSKPNALRERWNQVPTTIKDAIRVCIEFGIQYLWVDALCLVQDAPDLPRHLDKMTEIYDAAVMTIVAACADSSWTGLSGVSIARPMSQHRVSFGSMALIEPLPPLGTELENARWTQRGWTFQEHIFSRRCLIFLENRVVFQCNDGWTDESIDFDYRGRGLRHAKASTRMSLPALSPRGENFSFLPFVECFCKLELTYDSDALNACRGVIAWLEQNDTEFFWATPTNRMLAGLDFGTEALERRPDYPSWSWLGWRRPHPQEKGYQKFYGRRTSSIGHDGLCKIDIPSLRSDHKSHALGFDTSQLSASDLDKLLLLETQVASFSDLEGALFSRDDSERRKVRPDLLTHNVLGACRIELVRLAREFNWGDSEEPLYVICLIVKTDLRRVSERIGEGRVELSMWQTAVVEERTVYLI